MRGEGAGWEVMQTRLRTAEQIKDIFVGCETVSSTYCFEMVFEKFMCSL